MKEILIKEEYGANLGSHIYDSSIVMIRYLSREIYLEQQSYDEMNRRRRFRKTLELGAGCGVLSAWLSQYLPVIISTDLPQQFPLLEYNIRQLNHIENSQIVELDWNDVEKARYLKESQGNEIDLIVAADVFYDLEAARALLNVARILSNATSKIYIAQKHRQNSHKLSLEEGLSFMQQLVRDAHYDAVSVYHEAAVTIWMLSTKT